MQIDNVRIEDGLYKSDCVENWMLYKCGRYDTYDLIMSSETHTIDDLYKFAKTHHEIDLFNAINIGDTFLLVICIILGLINIKFKNDVIVGFIYGSCISSALYLLIAGHVEEHNLIIKSRKNIEEFDAKLKEIFEKKVGKENELCKEKN
jgi:hypothetical protein